MVIRKLTKSDARQFWSLRFKALREDEYASVGFKTYAKEKNAIKSDNKYYDEDYMVYFAK